MQFFPVHIIYNKLKLWKGPEIKSFSAFLQVKSNWKAASPLALLYIPSKLICEPQWEDVTAAAKLRDFW